MKGNLVGTIKFPEDFKHRKSEFESLGFFWEFSSLNIKYIHGSPNSSVTKFDEYRNESFQIPTTLFLEDFPSFYRFYRKDDKIEQANKALNQALDLYEKDTNERYLENRQTDKVLNKLSTYKNLVKTLSAEISKLEQNQEKYIKQQVNQSLPTMPKIDNDYLDLTRYNQLKTRYKVSDASSQDNKAKVLFENINKVINNFNSYKDAYIEDFL
jgi:type II secretory pathway pseudopilin PulG